MTYRPNCQICGHNYYDHNDYWDTVDEDGVNPIEGVEEGACQKCKCPKFTPPIGWEEDNPIVKNFYHSLI